MSFVDAFKLVKEAIELTATAESTLPSTPQKEACLEALRNAERAVSIAEAQIADLFNYNLCKCEWPPAIALLQSDGSQRCPKCGRDTNEDYQAAPVFGGY